MARDRKDQTSRQTWTYYERNQEYYSPNRDSGYDPGKDRLVRSPEWEEGQYPEDRPHKTAFRSSLEINPFRTEERPGPARGPERPGTHVGLGPEGYQRSDERIYEDVCELLTNHPDIDAGDMEVHVRDGVVTLSGTAYSRSAKRMAEDITISVPGVRDVLNRLRIPSVYKADAAAR